MTLNTLNDYREEVQKAQEDLEDQLCQIQDKLDRLSEAKRTSGAAPGTELERWKAEKATTEQCLLICEGIRAHIDSMHFQKVCGRPATQDYGGVPTSSSRADAITRSTITICRTEVDSAIALLETYHNELKNVLTADAKKVLSVPSQESDNEYRKLQREAEATKQCISVCTDAVERATAERVHIAENFSAGDDGRQLFVSSVGDLFSVKGVHAGNRALQVVGTFPTESLHHVFGSSAPR